MSFVQNYGVQDPKVNDSEETIFTKDENFSLKVEEHLEEEEYELEQIIEADSRRVD